MEQSALEPSKGEDKRNSYRIHALSQSMQEQWADDQLAQRDQAMYKVRRGTAFGMEAELFQADALPTNPTYPPPDELHGRLEQVAELMTEMVAAIGVNPYPPYYGYDDGTGEPLAKGEEPAHSEEEQAAADAEAFAGTGPGFVKRRTFAEAQQLRSGLERSRGFFPVPGAQNLGAQGGLNASAVMLLL